MNRIDPKTLDLKDKLVSVNRVAKTVKGGQMPLTRRLPKRGFFNPFSKVYTEVNVSTLDKFDEDTVITAELLKEKGVISKIEKDGVKVLGNGELTKRLTVQVAAFTRTAQQKIEALGGKAEVV